MRDILTRQRVHLVMRKSDSPNMRVSLKILMGLFSVNEKKKKSVGLSVQRSVPGKTLGSACAFATPVAKNWPLSFSSLSLSLSLSLSHTYTHTHTHTHTYIGTCKHCVPQHLLIDISMTGNGLRNDSLILWKTIWKVDALLAVRMRTFGDQPTLFFFFFFPEKS